MKKLFALTIIFVLVFTACGEKETEKEDNPLGKTGPGGLLISTPQTNLTGTIFSINDIEKAKWSTNID